MPKKIIILGKGRSSCHAPKVIPENTEVWGCTSTYLSHPVTALFEVHDKTKVLGWNVDFVTQVNNRNFPVYVKDEWPEIHKSRVYPIASVINEFGVRFFLNTLCYMIALAIMERPDEIELIGVDMRDKTEYLVEKGCVEFWCGVAIGRGINVTSSQCSNVMRNHFGSQYMMYAYEGDHQQIKGGCHGSS